MKKLQEALHETNLCLDNHGVNLTTALIQTGMMYHLSPAFIDVTQTSGRIEEIEGDYLERKVGIGTVVPEMKGFDEMLANVQSAAAKVLAVQSHHQKTLNDMTWLCFNHIEHEFPWQSTHFRGGLFRIQITAKTATFQILFLVWNGVYVPSHEVDLRDIADGGDVFRNQPFSQIPPNLMIPSMDRSWTYVPATYTGWKAALDDIPLNSKKKATQMYRSHTADVLESFGDMVEELLAA